jgi:2-polyprenyl-3-methyl-5-hydroxy-6-metoxy-1,4-benzoquinol methylase
MLGNQQFDVLIVMSVLQYYPNIAAVETLLNKLKQLAKPGATLLLCDLIVTTGMLKDIISALKKAWKRGQLFSMLSLMTRLRFSEYYDVQQKNGFLVIPQAEWLALCKRIGLRARFLDESLTLQQDRQNLLIEF